MTHNKQGAPNMVHAHEDMSICVLTTILYVYGQTDLRVF